MIELTRGDILQDQAEALVNTVNCVGVMGRGIALQFKKRFPANFKAYKKACDAGEVQPGRMNVHFTGLLTGPKYVINFPTKRHWRAKSRMKDIEAGLTALVSEVERLGIRSIAIPPLGCGLGGLHWPNVRRRIAAAFAALPEVQVTLYEPAGAPAAREQVAAKKAPRMTPGRAVLVGLMDRYLAGLMEPWVTLLELHKLMYFAQEAGEPLRLKFRKAHYGPYAENLRHVLSAVEGHMVTGYADGGDAPTKELELVPGTLEKAKTLLATKPDTVARFERVSQVVEGFESPYGLELLASVHWLVAHEGLREEGDVTQALHTWNQRKQRFSPRQVGIALGALQEHGWVN